MTTDRLSIAVAALKHGDRVAASQLLQALLADNPRSEQAWVWACEAAGTPEERIACLKHLLDVNPGHAGARKYLAQLEGAVALPQPAGLPVRPTAPPPSPNLAPAAAQPGQASAPPDVLDLLLAPLGWLLRLSPVHVVLVLVVAGLAIGVYYLTVNSDFFGLADPHLEQLAVSPSFDTYQAANVRWQINFEKPEPTHFAGVVRHVSPVHEVNLRIVTHDILVTSGDFALPARVSTAVLLHHFFWRAIATGTPSGAINLLHTVPATEAIYRQLLAIKLWDKVAISGREILDISIRDTQGKDLGYWTDTGCNSLVVQSVEIMP
jgi:hypothetical protein